MATTVVYSIAVYFFDVMKPEPFQRPITRNQFHSHVVY